MRGGAATAKRKHKGEDVLHGEEITAKKKTRSHRHIYTDTDRDTQAYTQTEKQIKEPYR